MDASESTRSFVGPTPRHQAARRAAREWRLDAAQEPTVSTARKPKEQDLRLVGIMFVPGFTQAVLLVQEDQYHVQNMQTVEL